MAKYKIRPYQIKFPPSKTVQAHQPISALIKYLYKDNGRGIPDHKLLFEVTNLENGKTWIISTYGLKFFIADWRS